IISLLSLIFMAGTIVMLVLLLSAGSHEREPLQRIHFLEADTRGIPNAPDGLCHWTLYNYCHVVNGQNHACRPPSAAYPMDPVRNFNTTTDVPRDFVQHQDRYFYLSRFLYAFYIISLFFCVAAFAVGLGSLCWWRAAAMAAAAATAAVACLAFCAAVMTACYVMAQNAFRADGRYARVGVKATAFTWTCLVCAALAWAAWVLVAFAGWKEHKRRREGGGVGRKRWRDRGRRREGFTRFGSVRRSRERGEFSEKRPLGPAADVEGLPAAAAVGHERGAGATT
ncbi:actin cortical patch protein Sur7, partial [Sphaerosporella brunnea]